MPQLLVEVTLGAVAFSAMVGVVFGWYPARQAARMEPIDALRHV
ncbi:MAG: ABC-type antimicrobial peptide transport system permease subunit [Cognaticolwellia sp.]|jgi:ABC-type antimicrobial peptide transport system permease subunit